ncbi:g2852 [Coccomyxa viridis]|uniref:G2852 protein n=1 Tax=Coccomyxa viridis TaxID=1274662 RepID=A0ABP1FNN8_9CHLO
MTATGGTIAAMLLLEGSHDVTPQLRLVYILISIGLVLLAGLMSGLTLGLMSMDAVDLEVLMRSGTPAEKKHAQRIAPVLKRPHWLLVTLLLVNAAAMEALPIFLDRLVSPTWAIVLSVTAVLFFGEIIPQALCSRFGLQIGAYSAWFVRILLWVVGIVSFPISKVLDHLLGSEHGALFRRAQLKALVDIHSTEFQSEGLGGGYLSPEEINIIRGALDMTEKKAFVGMTPLDKVFMLSSDALLDANTMKRVLASGHSRVPVHRAGSRRDIIGLILVKELAMVNFEEGLTVKDFKTRPLPMLRADTAMYDLLTLFQSGRSHMVVLRAPAQPETPRMGSPNKSMELAASLKEMKASDTPPARTEDGSVLVVSENGHSNGPLSEDQNRLITEVTTGTSRANSIDHSEPVGIITIEDVLEELLQHEIVDETDQFVDNMRSQKVNTATLLKSLPPHLRNMIVKGKGTMPIHAAAAAAAQAGRQPVVGSPKMRSAQSATLDSIPEAKLGAMRRAQTMNRALPPLQEPLLSDAHLGEEGDSSSRDAPRGDEAV